MEENALCYGICHHPHGWAGGDWPLRKSAGEPPCNLLLPVLLSGDTKDAKRKGNRVLCVTVKELVGIMD
ncbi:hypothetical protein E2C01_056663 [Portunus trituberculatus]|uniref:Uncharacterized protein n=1 Tax=Portunus trituberculatus TaxID=210409 RepID=A0A5B7GZS1_PORTR|nr:hypothetical protein [Portunus trituberculatus]